MESIARPRDSSAAVAKAAILSTSTAVLLRACIAKRGFIWGPAKASALAANSMAATAMDENFMVVNILWKQKMEATEKRVCWVVLVVVKRWLQATRILFLFDDVRVSLCGGVLSSLD
jgi:hypothetical protein